MFDVMISFIDGTRKLVRGLNRVQVNNVIKNWEKNPRVSYIGVLDENF